MLQQNNNNNSLCLDMAHRELLQGCGRSSAPLGFGAIGFGAIPLIKGLRAWAVSGGFNARNRRKTTGGHPNHQQTDRQRGWKTKENLMLRTPGALVTVATLKGSEGVRQTQTRCLFLKAEGCSYVCTVGNNRPAGSRAGGPRLHPNSAEATAGETYGSSRGRRTSQDHARACEVKPQAIRKWRKSSKVGKSATESRGGDVSLKLEQEQGANGNGASLIDESKASEPLCLKAKHKHAASSTQPGTGTRNTAGNEKVNDDDTHLHRGQPDTSAETSSSMSGSHEGYVGQEMLRPCKDSTGEATASISHKSDLVADEDLTHSAKTSDVPKSKEFSPEELMQVDISRNANINHSYEETSIASIVTASRNSPEGSTVDLPHSEMVIHSESLDMANIKGLLEVDASHDHELAGVENGFKAQMDKDSIKSENGQPRVIIHSKGIEKDGGVNMASTQKPLEDPDQGLDLSGIENGSNAKKDKDQSEAIIHSEEMENNESMSRTSNLEKDPGHGHDLSGMEDGSKGMVDKDLLKNENNQPEVCMQSEEPEKNEGRYMVGTKSPKKDSGKVLDLSGMEDGFKTRMDKDSVNNEKNQPEVVIHCEELENNEVMACTKSPVEVLSQDLSGVDSRSTMVDIDLLNGEKNQLEIHHFIHCKDLDIVSTRSPTEDPCEGHVRPLEEHNPPQDEEVNSGCEELWFAQSRSRGFPKAPATVATTRLLNPAFNITSNSTTAIATAPPALSRQEEVGAGFESLRPQPEPQLLSEQERGQDWSKVATNERPVEVDEEEEDEFGVFMQAGEEQIWTEFNELQQVPSGTHGDVGHRNSDANDPMSWTSDWTGVQSFHQSDDSWAAFKQEDDSRGEESEIAPPGQWWSSTAVGNTNLPLSSLQSVSRVFLEAFPSVESTCGEPDCVPTLKELLQRPAENHRAAKPQNQSLLDGLQDLDRMIDVKYKQAESLSRKLLLQSLHLGAVGSERTSRKQPTARFSPNLPTSNQQLAANAKRRLSYDINRNIMA